MNIEHLMRDCRAIQETIEKAQSELYALRQRIDEEYECSNSEKKYMYVKEFCDKYLFCSDSFALKTVDEPAYDKSKVSRSMHKSKRYTHIDPLYFMNYIESTKDEHPAVYNRMHNLINVSEVVHNLAKEAGIVNELV